jgi:hypothetical protein
MRRMVARYTTKPEKTEDNQRLIEEVFRELREKSPPGVRYLALKLDDGTFVHFVETEDSASPVSHLDAFRLFQSGINERCLEPPRTAAATIVGNYRMLGVEP